LFRYITVNTLHKGDKYNNNNNNNNSNHDNNDDDDDYVIYSISCSYLSDVLCPYQKMPSF